MITMMTTFTWAILESRWICNLSSFRQQAETQGVAWLLSGPWTFPSYSRIPAIKTSDNARPCVPEIQQCLVRKEAQLSQRDRATPGGWPAGCLYTRISSWPNARERVWEAF